MSRLSEKQVEAEINSLAELTKIPFRYQHSNGSPRIEDHSNGCETVLIGTLSELMIWIRGYRVGRSNEIKRANKEARELYGSKD